METVERPSPEGGNQVRFLGRREGALENPARCSKLCAGVHPVFHNQSSAKFLDKPLQVLELPHHHSSFSTDHGAPMYKDN